jgi:hypothetical protein
LSVHVCVILFKSTFTFITFVGIDRSTHRPAMCVVLKSFSYVSTVTCSVF